MANMITRRWPKDHYSYDVFKTMISSISQPYDAFYFHHGFICPKKIRFKINLIKYISEELVIFGIKDHLEDPGNIEFLKWLFQKFEHRKFILFTSVESIETIIDNSNVRVIPWGGEITNDLPEYKIMQPVIDKNQESDKTFLSLNRNGRSHRSAAMCMFLHHDLHRKNLISYNQNHVWSHILRESKNEHIRSIFKYGLENFSVDELTPGSYEHINNLVFPNGFMDIAKNFDIYLRKYYQDCFVEIVNETTFVQPFVFLTEKTMNCFMGCCIPIMLSNVGTVKFLRGIGFDMFDDIVNHSYDEITDPANRIYRAITDNLELLSNNARTKQIWFDNKYRFLRNVDVAKNHLDVFYTERVIQKFQEAKAYFDIK